MSRNEYDINKSKTGLTTHAFSKGRIPQRKSVSTEDLERIRASKEKAAAEKAALDAQSEETTDDTTDPVKPVDPVVQTVEPDKKESSKAKK